MCIYRWFKHVTEAVEAYKGKDKPVHRRSVRKAGSSGNISEAGAAETGAQDDEERIQEEEEEDEMDRQRKDSKEEYVSNYNIHLVQKFSF